VSAQGLAGYQRRLGDTFVLKDHRRLRHIPSLVLSERVQHEYPDFFTGVVERMFRIDNPDPKPGLRRIVREERRRAGIRLRDLARDAWTAMRGFG
jgi:electron transfer flavoprotein-quinone oxidoreductase